MNILYYYPEIDSYMGQWQKIHIFDELKRHGHTIQIFNPFTFPTFEQANIALIKFIKSKAGIIDLFMNSSGSDQIYPETILEVKKIGVKTLLICFDNLHAPFMHRSIAPYFDLVWLTSYETQHMFKKWQCNTCFMPYAANPNFFVPKYEKEIPAVGFIGTPYGTRKNKIGLLVKNNIPCQIYANIKKTERNEVSEISYVEMLNSAISLTRFSIGRKLMYAAFKKKYLVKDKEILNECPFLRIEPSVSFKEMNYLYSNLSICLGITELRNTYVLKNPIHKLHLRTFEVPMCGGLQLTAYTEELAGYFKEDEEIILYRSDEEMISKAKFYLRWENEKLRRNMKEKARLRAKSEHTWMNRFNVLFKLLSL